MSPPEFVKKTTKPGNSRAIIEAVVVGAAIGAQIMDLAPAAETRSDAISAATRPDGGSEQRL